MKLHILLLGNVIYTLCDTNSTIKTMDQIIEFLESKSTSF